MKKVSLFFMISFLLCSQAFAIFETRLTYGILAGKADLTKVYTGVASDVPAIAANYGLGADALFIIPVIGLGFGLRYENLGFKVTNNGLEYKTSSTRTAAIINYRIIDTLLFLGPILTYGISHSNNMKWSNATQSADLTPATSTSYSVGLEAGAKLGGFLLGAEAGYQSFPWKQMTDSKGVVTTRPDLDMSGTYAKVLFGFSI